MFFVISKVFWGIAQPVTALVLVFAAAFVFLLARWRRTGLTLLGLGTVAFFLIGLTNFGAMIIQPLENRFSRPDPMPASVDAIIVLGGGINSGVSAARDVDELNSSGDRFVEAVRLARLYPEAKVVITGGLGMLTPDGVPDATVAERFFPALGLEEGRLLIEGQSRNTEENAVYTRQMLSPVPGGTYLLVTSAFHMPRSVGLFRKAGFAVTPWPVDYKTRGNEPFRMDPAFPDDNIDIVTTAVREWIGLVAYALTGRIDSVFPGP